MLSVHYGGVVAGKESVNELQVLNRVKKIIFLPLWRKFHAILNQKKIALPSGPRVFVFLPADYGNIGDLAIAEAQRQFLTVALPASSVVAVPISMTLEILHSIRKQIMSDDVVTVIGGGNMGSLYPDIEGLRQQVIRSFPKNRVICFPQTLDWNDSDASNVALKRIVRVYSRHPDLHLFARETVSFKKLQDLFAGQRSVKVMLAPDIVLSATASGLGAGECGRVDRVLLCLRNDGERRLQEHEEAVLRQALAEAGLSVEETDTHAGGAGLSLEYCAQLVIGKLEQFQAARLVVTDRLHGMILAALTGTPCLVLPNSNHKIRQTWLDWLQEVPQVRFLALSEMADAGAAIHQLLAMPRRDPATPVVDPEHFADLRAALDLR